MQASMRAAHLFTVVAGLTACMLSISGAQAAPNKTGTGTHPAPKVYLCAGQLTRPADVVITMTANDAFYKQTTGAAPVTTLPVIDSGAMSAAEAKLKACKRRVIEIRVPSTASSGCGDKCYPNAEIHACAGAFPGSKEFEEHCRVPVSSTNSTKCKTFRHAVEVYKKPSGATEFNKTPVKSFLYKGFIDASGCRVAAKNLGQIHDTSEVYPLVTPPTSGMDVYRVLSLPNFDGALVDTVVVVEFEKIAR